ncbi:probable flavin-containing monooxygenase 1 [Beta vulgaris subsp. vulgaris]|uniref:probable flavin-containing monooxygenase 1 n=1 Tax=Beta vulgaris subsp. vulgaris TaxID=3555 RepID=UPI0025476889|nr:probable flavin-containing monooxygenase 1 [Beta vulgaris subsp. vulgaris]
MERKVGIIGAGISGLLACKYALSKGYHPIVFESRSTIGGVWSKTLETTKLQTPKPLYQFSDFPWPSSVVTDFPDHTQVIDYLKSYANHFDLVKHIRFSTRVVSIKYEGASDEENRPWLWGGNGDPFGNTGKWAVTAQDLHNQSVEPIIRVDFVILCLGRFSDVPNIPEFPSGKGSEVFAGETLHSIDYSAMDFESAKNLVKGKQVTVVGFQKSAIDIAMECSIVNGLRYPCTIICRTPHWNVADSFPWDILYMSRFSELLLHKPDEGPLLSILASLLSPLRWGISKFVESEIKKKYPIEKYGMVPNHSFLQEMSSCSVATIPEGFYNNADKGSIIMKRSPSFSFFKEGIVLDDSIGPTEHIKSDLVIYATGFKGDQKLKNIFESPKFQDLITGSYNEIVPLYRHCLRKRIPFLAVIGYSESSANLYTSEIRCRWLFELLDGKFKLPNIIKMEKDIKEWDTSMKRYAGKYYRRSCIGALHICYNDQLCKDMGWKPKRKNGLWAELFEPYGPMDYA